MLNFASAGLGLLLLAAGVYLITLNLHRMKKVDAPASPLILTSNPRALPVLSAAQLFEQTGTLGVLASIEAKLGFSREYFQRCVQPVVNAYAGFVQQLPAPESAHSAQPGGLLIRALNMVDFALTFRRGQILPRHAAPEDIMRLEHRWTYAVFMAALLHDVGKPIAGLRVTLYGPDLVAPKIWAPLLGSISQCGGTQYSVEFVEKGQLDESSHEKLSASLFQRWVPEGFFGWLSTEPELVSELMATLSGDLDCGSGAIKELVSRAQAEWLKRNCVLDFRESGTPAGALLQIATPKSADDLAAVKDAIAVVESTSSSSVQGSAVARLKGASRHQEEYLDDVEELATDGKSKSAVNHVDLTAPSPQLLPPVTPALPVSLSSGYEDVKAPSEAALRFMSWLQAGLANGTLTFNQVGAMVHFVREGMLLVSPKIFQRFARAFGEDGRGVVSSEFREKKDLGMGIQRQWFKAGWHIQGEKGTNILPYQVLRTGKPAARISGVVVADPQRFVSPVPPANPHIEKLTISVEEVREHAISP